MMFSAMLTDAFHDSDIGIGLRYWFHGKPFKLQTGSNSKVQNDINCDFLFTVDCTFNGGIQSKMQESVDMFSAACGDFGHRISTKKTEILYKPILLHPV